MKIVKCILLAGVITVLAVAATREIRYNLDAARRRQQIGSLWMFISLYYCPRHHERFPSDLAELKAVPEYNTYPEYWDRARAEITLTAPGVDRKQSDGTLVVLAEKNPDEKGFRWIHQLGGMIKMEKARVPDVYSGYVTVVQKVPVALPFDSHPVEFASPSPYTTRFLFDNPPNPMLHQPMQVTSP